MAQSPERRQSNRAAQRRIARELRENRYQRRTPSSIRKAGQKAQVKYTESRMGQPTDRLTSGEKKLLARQASLASWGKSDPRFEEEFKHLWYHKNGESL